MRAVGGGWRTRSREKPCQCMRAFCACRLSRSCRGQRMPGRERSRAEILSVMPRTWSPAVPPSAWDAAPRPTRADGAAISDLPPELQTRLGMTPGNLATTLDRWRDEAPGATIAVFPGPPVYPAHPTTQG